MNAADVLITLMIESIAASQRYAAVLQQASAEGREVSFDDLAALRATDKAAADKLDAAIAAAGG